MKKLLPATDVSPRSELALRRVLRLAREHGAALAMVHNLDESSKHSENDELRPPVGGASQDVAEGFAARHLARDRGLSFGGTAASCARMSCSAPALMTSASDGGNSGALSSPPSPAPP